MCNIVAPHAGEWIETLKNIIIGLIFCTIHATVLKYTGLFFKLMKRADPPNFYNFIHLSKRGTVQYFV